MSAKNANRFGAGLKVLLVVVVLAGIAAFAWTRFFVTGALVSTVKLGTALDVVTGSVVVHADGDYKDLKMESGGVVQWCAPLDPSNHFSAGDVLLRLDTTDIDRLIDQTKRTHQSAVDRAEIQKKHDQTVELAQQKLEDAKRLLERNIASPEDVKAAERAVSAAKMAVELNDLSLKDADASFDDTMKQLQTQREKMEKKAPFDGVVKDVFAWKGALLAPGATIATVYSNARLVVAQVSEESVAKVKVGQPVEMTLVPFPGRKFTGKVKKILPTADDAQRYSVQLDIDAKPDDLIPYASGEARITVDEHPNKPLMRRTALFDGNFVCVVKNGRVQKREVELGLTGLNVVEITKGVAPGEQVIVDAPDEFRDGQRVTSKAVD